MTVSEILCPVDLSDASAQAADVAVAVAECYGAHLTGLSVVSSLMLALPTAPPSRATSDAGFDDSEIARVRGQVAARFAAAQRGAAVEVDVHVVMGEPVAEILAWASRVHASLVIMGTHGAGGFEHLVLGSVAEKVLRRAPCPVLTVPPHAHAPSTVPFRRVLCAVDASDSSREAAACAASLAAQCRGELTILHVLEWPWDEPPAPRFADLPVAQAAALAEYRRYRETQARTWLESATPTPPGPLADLTLRVAHGRAPVQIVQIARELPADVIVLGVGSRPALDRTLFGSTVHRVVREAPCPVMTVRTPHE